MTPEKREKLAFVCFLTASICYFITGSLGMLEDEQYNWGINMCLGATFLCLSLTHIKRKKD